ncbi:MAG: helix-turn-helix transcriptional regulator [Firmicutes bacterium]|uniref:Helix-turn-helix transcriptional regulator n=1 Tax=Candidatus Gallilactobacillus intestinavium TaxID=2840838 RepID=A0A9D9E6T2_9LACO|nr:helix-turn-helix transcriptional regulator [Candidatus Gallilactobacillus intestinavium]
MYQNINIGNRIRNYRIKKKMTQEKLAEYSDLSVNFISKLERGQKKNISINKLLNICNALNITVSELLDDDLNINGLSTSTKELVKILRTLNSKDSDKISAILIPLVKQYKNLIDDK